MTKISRNFFVRIIKAACKGQLISKGLFDQKTNEIFLRISALASKKRSDQKNKGTL